MFIIIQADLSVIKLYRLAFNMLSQVPAAVTIYAAIYTMYALLNAHTKQRYIDYIKKHMLRVIFSYLLLLRFYTFSFSFTAIIYRKQFFYLN